MICQVGEVTLRQFHCVKKHFLDMTILKKAARMVGVIYSRVMNLLVL